MNKQFRRIAVAAGSSLALVGAAQAAVPADVTTAITSAGADLVTAATAIIVAMVAFWGLKKMGSKLGWF